MFICHFCNYKAENLKSHLKHRKCHRHLTSFYRCGYHGCKVKFSTENSLRSHLIRSHKIYVRKLEEKSTICASNNEAKFICTVKICKKEMDSYNVLIRHLKEHMKNGLMVSCPYNLCNKKYDRITSFSGHLTKHHKSQILATNIDDEVEINNAQTIDNELEVNSKETNQNLLRVQDNADFTRFENASDSDEDGDNKLFINALATFYLKLECQYLIPENTIQYIVEELKTLSIHEQSRIEKMYIQYGLKHLKMPIVL